MTNLFITLFKNSRENKTYPPIFGRGINNLRVKAGGIKVASGLKVMDIMALAVDCDMSHSVPAYDSTY